MRTAGRTSGRCDDTPGWPMLTDIHRLYHPFLAHFRAGRMRMFRELFELTERTRVLDRYTNPARTLAQAERGIEGDAR